MKQICILGLGYMGLPLACNLAKAGYKVLGVDINKEKIKNLRRKKLETTEPGLKKLFQIAVGNNNLNFYNKIQPADVFIIAVPTPATNRRINLKYIKLAAKMVTQVIQKNNLVILESTVAPNTCKKVIKPILDQKKTHYFLAHCPERAIPGNTLYELQNNDRIIGGLNKESAKNAKEIYRSFVKGKIYLTDLTTAETVKLLENSFRDINIAFANEIAKLSEKININLWEAIELANKHPRVNILKPGPGVGGHCIPIDPWFLIQDEPKAKFIRLAREINDSMPEYIVNCVKKLIKKQKPTIAILGVAYKADVDDARETPSSKIICLMQKKGWNIKVTDPYVTKYHLRIMPLEKALEKTDGAVLVTDHTLYKKFNFKKYSLSFIFDTRNIISEKQLSKETRLIKFGSNLRSKYHS